MLCDLGLDRRVDLACGWSPEDVPKFAGEGIDFLFIDGFHAGSAPLRDFKALRPYLASDAVIYWHDTDQRGVASALKVAGEPWKALDTEYHLARMSLNGCPS
jgi:predicted O-methyltransferase YrrM